MPILVIVAVALCGYGTLIAAVVGKSLQVSESKGRGFYRKTVLMISTLAGLVLLCVAIVADVFSNVTLIQVFDSLLCSAGADVQR